MYEQEAKKLGDSSRHPFGPLAAPSPEKGCFPTGLEEDSGRFQEIARAPPMLSCFLRENKVSGMSSYLLVVFFV